MNQKVKKSIIKIIQLFVIPSLCFLMLTSCTAKNKSQPNSPINQHSTSTTKTPNFTPIPTKQLDSPPPKTAEKVVKSWTDYDNLNLPLISAIPEKKIYLYGIKPDGVILYVGGKGFYYNWIYMTPRFVLPQMYANDFDKDNIEELAIITYVGSGTGVALEELHIIELTEKEYLSDESLYDYSKSNPEYFKDHFYEPDKYLAELKKSVKFKTYKKENELMADISMDNKSYTVSLKDYQSNNYGIINNNPCFGDIVYFTVENNQITAQFGLGITSTIFSAPHYIGDVYANVSYKNGKFAMNKFRFVKNN